MLFWPKSENIILWGREDVSQGWEEDIWSITVKLVADGDASITRHQHHLSVWHQWHSDLDLPRGCHLGEDARSQVEPNTTVMSTDKTTSVSLPSYHYHWMNSFPSVSLCVSHKGVYLTFEDIQILEIVHRSSDFYTWFGINWLTRKLAHRLDF